MDRETDPTIEQPRFSLRADQPMAAHVLRILAALERHHFGMAEVFLADAIAAAGATAPASQDRFLEVLKCSDEMETWTAGRRPAPEATGLNAHSAARQIPKSGSTATPNAADAAA